ncbi:K(+)-transporting ATPase subunit F [Azonexus sp.]|nr:K(+)-transporting ATPase subunit F [Azonexus sp.]
MTWLFILSGVVAVGLLVYLIAALINPEDFS